MLPARRQAILVAMFPSLALALLNHFYLRWTYDLGLQWFYVIDAFQWVVIPWCVWKLLLKPQRITFTDIGFALRLPGGTPSVYAYDFVVALVVLSIAYVPIQLVAFKYFWPNVATFGYRNAIPRTFPWNDLAALYFSTTAAVIEESVFRGLAWSYMSGIASKYKPKLCYVAVTSLLFAAAHSEQGPDGMIAALSFGIAASLLYLHFRNLWPLVFGHFVIDAIRFWPAGG